MNKFYLCIRASMLFGIFSSLKHMQVAIEEYIKDIKETEGTPLGDFHFRYIEFEANEPWFTTDSNEGELNNEVARAIFSLSTMHDEYFPNKIETNWSTGEIISI